MSEFSATTRVKAARKQHVCSECRRVISVGGGYLRRVARFDGNFYSAKACPQCEVLGKIIRLIDSDSSGSYIADWFWQGMYWEYARGLGLDQALDLKRLEKAFSRGWQTPTGEEHIILVDDEFRERWLGVFPEVTG